MNDERDLTEEEIALWEFVTENDKRWKKVKKKSSEEAPSENKKKKSKLLKNQPSITAKNRPEVKEHEYLEVGDFSGVDGNTADRLKRGKLRPEATLDLHGMTQSEAADALFKFVKSCYQRNMRSVIVITGKGNKDGRSIGVLRQSVPNWLNAPSLRPFVLSISQAHAKDGGAGALYVLLRKNRD